MVSYSAGKGSGAGILEEGGATPHCPRSRTCPGWPHRAVYWEHIVKFAFAFLDPMETLPSLKLPVTVSYILYYQSLALTPHLPSPLI